MYVNPHSPVNLIVMPDLSQGSSKFKCWLDELDVEGAQRAALLPPRCCRRAAAAALLLPRCRLTRYSAQLKRAASK
jgi:hypothetical protein